MSGGPLRISESGFGSPGGEGDVECKVENAKCRLDGTRRKRRVAWGTLNAESCLLRISECGVRIGLPGGEGGRKKVEDRGKTRKSEKHRERTRKAGARHSDWRLRRREPFRISECGVRSADLGGGGPVLK